MAIACGIGMRGDPAVRFARERGMCSEAERKVVEADWANLDPTTAVHLHQALENLASDGAPLAMCALSRIHAAGLGVERSDAAALAWARRAVAAGFAPAHYELARLLESGSRAAEQEDVLEHYGRAALMGFGLAAYRLGVGFADGSLGDATRKHEALGWLLKGIELLEPLAAMQLGQWYEFGENVRQSDRLAATYYEIASTQGSYLASLRLESAYSIGELGLSRDSQAAKDYALRAEQQVSALLTDEEPVRGHL